MNKKKASGLQPIEKPVKSITKNVFKNRNFKENLFFRDWEAIVGASISDYSKPEKLTNNKKLVVLVQSCHALDFEYRMPEIMNSIRTFYGYNPVKKIVIKLGSSTVVDKKGNFKRSWVDSLVKDIKRYRKNDSCRRFAICKDCTVDGPTETNGYRRSERE